MIFKVPLSGGGLILPLSFPQVLSREFRVHWRGGRAGSAQKGLRWSPGPMNSFFKGNSYLLQYSCLKNPLDRVAWWATVHRVAKSQTTKGLIHTQGPGPHSGVYTNSISDSCCNFRDILSPFLATLHWTVASTTLARVFPYLLSSS